MFRTKKQQKELCKDCPVAKVADLFGDPCSLLVMRDLLRKPRRFSELQNSLSGISSRTLTNKLKRLEDNKLISRAVFREKPPHVEYSLTKKGAAFQEVEKAMRSYGKKYL